MDFFHVVYYMTTYIIVMQFCSYSFKLVWLSQKNRAETWTQVLLYLFTVKYRMSCNLAKFWLINDKQSYTLQIEWNCEMY